MIYNFSKGCTALWSSMVVDTWTTPSSGKTSAPEVWQPFVWRKFTDFPGSGEPEGELEAAIVRDFGSVAAMKEKLSASTVAVQVLSKSRRKFEVFLILVNSQGSGWGWLGYNKAAGKLQIAACANQVQFDMEKVPCPMSLNFQDPLEATTGLVPLFGIDVWEHAYYLQVFISHFSALCESLNILCFSTRTYDLTMWKQSLMLLTGKMSLQGQLFS